MAEDGSPERRLSLGRGWGWRRWGWAAASVVVHAGLLVALVAATDDQDQLAAAETGEEITYVDISSFPPPPPPAVTAAEPEPTPQRAEPQPTQPQRPAPRPQTPPRATDIIEPEPDSVLAPLGEIPPPQPIAPPIASGPPSGQVTAGSRTGGQAGGRPGGQEGGVEGGRVGGEVGATGPPEGGTFVAAVVDRIAQLRNRGELPRIMERLYPVGLKEAGIGGRVVVQFVVDTNGRVDMGSAKIMSAEHDGLVEPTLKALREFRFSAAKMGDQTVRMLTQMPIVWQVER